MLKNVRLLFVLSALFLMAGAGQCAISPLSSSLQAVVVTTADWDASTGALACFERATANGPWHPTGLAFPVVVGKKGLGWGSGRHPQEGLSGPTKHEGDGKALAGVFLLNVAFGYAPREQVKWVRLPYTQCTSDLQCVDDVNSIYYNSLVNTSAVAQVDWHSAEEMRRSDDLYRMGVVVEHNTHPRTPGGGSCIFLHIWGSPRTFTSGCTAMAAENLEALLKWLELKSAPVLLQLPRSQYQHWQKPWALPDLGSLKPAGGREGVPEHH